MAIHEHVLHNGEIRRASEPMLSPGQLGLLAGWGVFTTVRVMDGAVFAWERHWARMKRDAKLVNVALPFECAAVERDLMRLVEANGRPDCTMRVAAVRNRGGFWEGPAAPMREAGHATDLIALTADLNRWGETVRLGIQPNARFAANEFSGAKILSWAQNLTWAERAHDAGFDEVILLNERGNIAECTSANIFVVSPAVSGREVLTPPLGDGCLPGVTREILLEAQPAGIRVLERSLGVEDLYAADEVLITSTTRNLLPVAEIAGTKLERKGNAGTALADYLAEVTRRDIARRRSAMAVAQERS